MTPKERQRARFLQQAFNITPSEWELIHTHQHGVCFICGKPQKGKRLSTDHCHQTGLLRGLLCNKCNAWLGKIENNFRRYGLHKVITLRMAILLVESYLRQPPATLALGRAVIGYPGKIGTKKYRAWAKKKGVQIDASIERT